MMARDYSDQDYDERCSDVDTALQATRERIEEWDQADLHGWWHERPHLIALVGEIERLWQSSP